VIILYNPFINNYKSKRLNSNNPTIQGNQQASMLMNGVGRYNTNPYGTQSESLGQRVNLLNKMKQIQNDKDKSGMLPEHRPNEVNSSLKTTPNTPSTQKISNVQNQINNGNVIQNVNSVGKKVANNSLMKEHNPETREQIDANRMAYINHLEKNNNAENNRMANSNYLEKQNTTLQKYKPTPNQNNGNDVELRSIVNPNYDTATKQISIGNTLLNPNQYQVINGKAYVNPLALGTTLATQSPEYTQNNFQNKAKLIEKMLSPTIQSNEAFLNTEKEYAQNKYNLSKLQQENALKQQLNSINEQKQQTSGDLAQALAMRGLDTSGVFSGQMGDMAVDFAKMYNQAQDTNALRQMEIGMNYDKNISDLNNKTLDFKSKMQQQINDQAINMIDKEGQQTNNLGRMFIDQHNAKLNNAYKYEELNRKDNHFNQELGFKEKQLTQDNNQFNAKFNQDNNQFNAKFNQDNYQFNTKMNQDNHQFNTKINQDNNQFNAKMNQDNHQFNTKINQDNHQFNTKLAQDKAIAELNNATDVNIAELNKQLKLAEANSKDNKDVKERELKFAIENAKNKIIKSTDSFMSRLNQTYDAYDYSDEERSRLVKNIVDNNLSSIINNAVQKLKLNPEEAKSFQNDIINKYNQKIEKENTQKKLNEINNIYPKIIETFSKKAPTTLSDIDKAIAESEGENSSIDKNSKEFKEFYSKLANKYLNKNITITGNGVGVTFID
jgi:polyhydroxyalkanoate synthesis regulator phasin